MTSTRTQEDRRHNSARIAYERGDLRGAMAVIRECLADDRDDGRAWELLGLVHFAGGNFNHSVSSFEHASLLVPLRSPGRVGLAHAYARVGKTQLAIDLLSDLVEDPSISESMLLQIATCLDQLGCSDVAMRVCHRVIRQNDRCAQAYYELGFYASRCDYDLGMIEILGKRAVELAPEVPRYRVGLAGLLYRQERFDDAWNQVKDFSNSDIASLSCVCCAERIVDLYQRQQDYRRAVLCRQRLLELEVDGQSDCS